MDTITLWKSIHNRFSSSYQFIVENNTISYEFYRIFVVEGHGTNPGLSQVTSTAICLFRLICSPINDEEKTEQGRKHQEMQK